jgi:SAM-dependent methyltransferase
MPVVVESPDERAAEIFERVVGANLPNYDPWIQDYCEAVATPAGAERYVRHLRDLLRFAQADPRDADVVDVGCLFGFTLLTLLLLGARSARGLDLYPGGPTTIQAYRAILPETLRQRISAEIGDAAKMPYPDESTDLMFSIEAISHYRDVHAFVREAQRVLRAGGVLIIADSNNALNPLTRRKTHRIWRKFEEGAGLNKETTKPYRQRREEWIAEHYPELPARDLAATTYGYDFAELDQVCRTYSDTGAMPLPRPKHHPPVQPEDGQVLERLRNPFALANEIRRGGFATRVRGYWGGAGGRASVRAANTILSTLTPVTMPFARSFRIAARKLAT